MNRNFKRILKILVLFLFVGITIAASAKAVPTFSEYDKTIHIKQGEIIRSTVIVYDDDIITDDTIILLDVKAHPDYLQTPSYVRNIQTLTIDQHAILVTFEVFVPNGQSIGFHREIITLNNQDKLNLAISVDGEAVSFFHKMVSKQIKIGETYLPLGIPIVLCAAIILIVLILFLYYQLGGGR